MFFEEDGPDPHDCCIHPPNEAESIPLKGAPGCLHNECAFCGAHKAIRFAATERAVWERELDHASRHGRGRKRLCVVGCDALAMPMPRWEWLLENIARRLPWVERVSTHADAKSVALKSDGDLERLRSLGLGMVHYGLESGHPAVLARMRKGADPKALLIQAHRLKKAGFALSVSVIAGLGGKEISLAHARATGRLLSRMDPDHVGVHTMVAPPGASLPEEMRSGSFILPDPLELLEELGVMLAYTDLSSGLFTADPAGDGLSLKVRLPHGKEAALGMIRDALLDKLR